MSRASRFHRLKSIDLGLIKKKEIILGWLYLIRLKPLKKGLETSLKSETFLLDSKKQVTWSPTSTWKLIWFDGAWKIFLQSSLCRECSPADALM